MSASEPEKLLPCPWCGGELVLSEYGAGCDNRKCPGVFHLAADDGKSKRFSPRFAVKGVNAAAQAVADAIEQERKGTTCSNQS